MAVRLGDLLISSVPAGTGGGIGQGVSLDRLNELRNMIQQASARLEAISLEAKLRPASTAQIDQLKSQITDAQGILATQRQKLAGQTGTVVVGTLPANPTTYLIGALAVTLIPNPIGSGEDLPPGGPPDPPGTPGPSGLSYLDIVDPYVQLEVDTIQALLEQATLGVTGAGATTATLPNSIAEVDALQTKLASAQESLDEMRMLSSG